MRAIQEVFLRYKREYAHGDKTVRSRVLDIVCDITQMHRKSAIRKFKRILHGRKRETESRGRPRTYGKDVDAALYDVWEVGSFCCSELLHSEVPVYIESLSVLGKWRHDDVATGLLRALSLGEMKRRIGGLRVRHRIRGRASTTPSTIKRKVKVYAGPWRNRTPGHRQFDSVVHCGDRLQGDMVYTINGVDTAIMWSNRRAQWNKGEIATMASVEHIEARMPTVTLSRHSDSGSEFLNFYFLEKSERARITQTRSRSGKSNDNAFVEERNNSIVRKWIGYERYDTPGQVDALNALYEKLDLYLNHFQAVRRCVRRERAGAKYVRVYDKAQTPYARALAHRDVPYETKEKLRVRHATLNPVTLLAEIDTLKSKLATITRVAVPKL